MQQTWTSLNPHPGVALCAGRSRTTLNPLPGVGFNAGSPDSLALQALLNPLAHLEEHADCLHLLHFTLQQHKCFSQQVGFTCCNLIGII